MRGLEKITIIANGESPRTEIIDVLRKDKEMIITADGGATICRECGITPYYIIGDLDSMEGQLDDFPHTEIIKIESQETTDMQKALDFAVQFNPEKINIYAALGNRCDHTLANLFLFYNYEYHGELTVYDNYGYLKILDPGKHRMSGNVGELISFFSFSEIKKLQLRGFKYPLAQKDHKGNFYSISNEFTKQKAIVSFTSGKLLYYRIHHKH